MDEKKSNSFLKALWYSFLKTLFPGLLMLGLFFGMVWLSFVFGESKEIFATILGIILFIITAFIMAWILSLFIDDSFSDVFSSPGKGENKSKIIVKKVSENKYEVTRIKDSDAPFLLFFIFYGALLGICSIPLFFISLVRLIINKKLRIEYNEKLKILKSDLRNEFVNKKKFMIISSIICLVGVIPITLYARNLQVKHGIYMFKQIEKEYNVPKLKAVELSTEMGGVYNDGYRVSMKIEFSEFQGEEISGMYGSIKIVNLEDKTLLEAQCNFNSLKENSVQVINIDCRNSAEILELCSYSVDDVKIYYYLESILYTDYNSVELNELNRIN